MAVAGAHARRGHLTAEAQRRLPPGSGPQNIALVGFAGLSQQGGVPARQSLNVCWNCTCCRVTAIDGRNDDVLLVSALEHQNVRIGIHGSVSTWRDRLALLA
jgi:hypothetical protein